MESLQCVRNEEISVQLSVEEKTTVDEIVKQAELSMESQELVDESIGVVAENECLDKAVIATETQVIAGSLKNQTKGPLTVMATKIYEGLIVKNFPSPLKVGGSIMSHECAFIMASMFHKGVKAAVVYSGKNKDGVECAWLLAFADTKATGKRIYAECGRKDKFRNINWAHVEQKLNNAGTDSTKAHDLQTGTSLCATIASSPIKYRVGIAFVGATFIG